MSVGSANSQFKAHVLRALGALDPRFAALVRAVKVWAAAHGVNDASSGTFNSFALSLMVKPLTPLRLLSGAQLLRARD